MRSVNGLHHVTAISGPAQENLDFYTGVLGMRLVKRSVNQDDPGTYHLFYADAEGHAGHRPHVLPVGAHGAAAQGHRHGRRGRRSPSRRTASTSGARGSSATACRRRRSRRRFGERALPLVDPHGLEVALVESADAPTRAFTPWDESPVPAERSRFAACTARGCWERELPPTAHVPHRRARLHARRRRRATGIATASPAAARALRRRARSARRARAARGASARFTISPGASTMTRIRARGARRGSSRPAAGRRR